jgi:hypothetical protein
VYLIARGISVKQAAVELAVHPERLRRWMATRRFQLAIELERQRPMKPRQLSGGWLEGERDAER